MYLPNNPMSKEEELQNKLKEVIAERNRYHAELTDIKLKQLRTDVDDHETRIRTLETIATRSNVLYALATGGGLISIVTLVKTLSEFP